MMDIDEREARARGAHSIAKAGRLVIAVAAAGPTGGRLSTLAAAVGLPHPTVHRMLKALCEVGVLYRPPRSHRYLLGEALTERRVASPPAEVLQRMVRPALIRLATTLGDNVFLSVRERYEAVCLDRMEGQFPIRFGLLDIGVRRPLGIGAASLALLASLPDDVIEDSMRVNRPALIGPHAPEKLHILIEQTRHDGYAFDDGRLFPGGCGIGMVISAGNGETVGAISIGAISGRMQPERVRQLAGALRAEAHAIAKALEARAQLYEPASG